MTDTKGCAANAAATPAELTPEARALNIHDVALFDDLCKTFSKRGKRTDEHWLAKWCLERYDQVMPALLAALPENERARVKAHCEAEPW